MIFQKQQQAVRVKDVDVRESVVEGSVGAGKDVEDVLKLLLTLTQVLKLSTWGIIRINPFHIGELFVRP